VKIRAARFGLCVLAAAVVSGWSDAGDPSSEGVRASWAPRTPVRAAKPAPLRPSAACRAGERRLLGGARLAFAGVVRERTLAYRSPGRGPFASFDRLNVNDYPTVFNVLESVLGRDCKPRWYRVLLPLRPNGATGYVRAEQITLRPVRARIAIDLSERSLTLFRGGRRVLRATAAVGTPATPTPSGRFYVNQRLVPGDPSGPFGPGALGISAFSEVLTDWVQGGPIAIHGTNAPSSIGLAISHGCVRVDNDVLRRLFAAVPAGAPVTIQN
jgi:L,D-transpeptidase catalytic domain